MMVACSPRSSPSVTFERRRAHRSAVPVVVDQLYEFLQKLVDEGASLLLVEQYVSRALAAADLICVMTKGSVVFTGPPSEVGDDIFDHYLGAGAGAH